jgi:Lar family restriction alleviation protein
MTNGEKFKTAEERAKAFDNYCISQKSGCNKCPLNKYAGDACRFKWLELEAKEELLPCPFCGGTPVMADNIETMRSLSYFVWCACGARFASALSVSAAAEMWNRRAK